MRPDSDRLLVIADAGLPALVASMLWPEPGSVLLWVPPTGAPTLDTPSIVIGERHRAGAEAQADLLGLAGVESAAASPVGSLSPSMLLLLACEHAAREGIGTVVWPVVCGESLEALASASDRARLLTRLASLDAGSRPTVSVRTPLADLTEIEVAELALDLDAPLETLWWRRPPFEGEPSAPEAELRLKWEGAVREAAQRAGVVGASGETPGRTG